MACSCKIQKTTIYIDPLTNEVYKEPSSQLFNISDLQFSDSSSQFDALIPEKITASNATFKGIKSLLDISTITKPDQFCINCIRKHLGLAYIFIRQGNYKRFRIAIGELMCASLHLKNSFYNLSLKVRDIALQLLRQQDKDKDKEVQLVKDLIAIFTVQPKEDLQEYKSLAYSIQQEQLLLLFMLYSLLFVQINYQQVNKTWATAYLSAFSYNTFEATNSIQNYQIYRPLWKLIQSMSFLDQNYLAARDYLDSVIASKYPLYTAKLS